MKITMTVHQRLAAQQRAVRNRAAWARHRREVALDGDEGWRCGTCYMVPLLPWESQDEEQRASLESTAAFMEAYEVLPPDGQDPKAQHIQWALGYRD